MDPALRSAVEALYRGAANQSSRYRAVVVATGGGSQALGWLLSVPGASSVILECSVPYSRASSDALLSALALSSVTQTTGSCSRETSIALARTACHRAMQLVAMEATHTGTDKTKSDNTSAFTEETNSTSGVINNTTASPAPAPAANDYWSPNSSSSSEDDLLVGIGVTGALASTWTKRGDHRCFVTVCDSLARTRVREVRFTKGMRDRMQEDEVCSRVLVRALLDACGQSEQAKNIRLLIPPCNTDSSRAVEGLIEGEISPADDGVVPVGVIETEFHALQSQSDNDGWSEEVAGVELKSVWAHDAASRDHKGVYSAVNELFDEPSVQMVVCVPRPLNAAGVADAIVVPFINALPMVDTVILPGSFNPVHHGHKQLAQRACDLASKHFGRPFSAVFEITTDNADKGQMDRQEAQKRVDQFAPHLTQSVPSRPVGGEIAGDEGGWAVALTQTARFVEKARLFPNSAFVLGVDTGVRLIDPKYYNNDTLEMQEALLQIRELGCHIIVAGRKMKTVNSGREEYQFETFESAMKDKLPPLLQSMFLSLGEDDFRVDLSSTEIRKRLQEEQEQSRQADGCKL